MSKATKPSPKKMSKLEKRERVQQQELNIVQRQQRWFRWAIIAILVLLFLLLLAVGYATGWFKGDDRNTISQEPLSGQLTGTDATATPQADVNTTGRTTTGTNNGTNTSTNTVTKESSNSSTTKEVINNNNGGGTPQPSQALIDLNSDLNSGDNINEIKTLADSLGIEYACRTILLTVEECTFGTGGAQIITRNPLISDAITSITNNF